MTRYKRTRTYGDTVMDHEPVVGILVDYLSHYGRNVILGVGRYLRMHQRWTLMGEPRRVVAPIGNLRTWRGDGVIAQVWDDQRRDKVLAMKKRGIEVVDVGGVIPGLPLPQVTPDDEAIGTMAADYFITRGFRRLAFSGPAGHAAADKRLKGFSDRAALAGAAVSIFEPRRLHRYAGGTEADVRELGQWVKSMLKPVAVLGWHDGRARQIADACYRIGVRVPEDVAIVGVDDDEINCELADPPLSSVAVPIEQVGYQAAVLLADLMAGRKTKAVRTLVPPIGVVTRRSSDSLAIEDPELVEVMRVIRNHARKPLSVKELLQIVPMSRRNMERQFQKLIGHSPHAEIERVHLEQAKRLLAETDWPLPRIAAESGYNSHEHFTHTFRNKIGVAPGAYRRRYRDQRRLPSVR